jgi:DNA-directed RNA polymerase specialized sigma24 family protein
MSRKEQYRRPLTEEQRAMATEALPWVRAKLQCYAASRLPARLRADFADLAGEVCVRLAQEYRPGGAATWRTFAKTCAVARALDVDQRKARGKAARRARHAHHSLDCVLFPDRHDGRDVFAADILGVEDSGPDHVEARDEVETLLRHATLQERAVVRLTTMEGLADVEAHRLVPRLSSGRGGRVIGHGVSPSRVCQLRERGLARIRKAVGAAS